MATRRAPDKFPLWLHPIGQWCKKHKGRPYYFGTDREAALKRYVNEWPDIVAGKARKRSREKVVTVADVVNSFLTEKRSKVESGELSERTWADYYAACDVVVDHFGRDAVVTDLGPSDFAALRKKTAIGRGPVSVLNFVTRVRVLFKHAYDFDLIDKPVKYGSAFSRPPKAKLRLVRHLKAKRLIPAAELLKLIDGADAQLRCMIYLALNGGMGSTDCAQLPRSALEQRPGWCVYPRPKTQVRREFPLWQETVEALAAVQAIRPAPNDAADDRLVFLTRLGKPWVRFHGDGEGKR
ncbi:MAG TPA: hypothetical protein VKD90_26935, partial [Gemmataceae bacterium]|nr:hypothetical protein [Gemmataceae bacterium]